MILIPKWFHVFSIFGVHLLLAFATNKKGGPVIDEDDDVVARSFLR